MHVLQILPALGDGGVERGAVEIAQALVAAGHRASVISSGGRLVSAVEAAGGHHIEMPVGAKRLATLGQVAALRDALARLRPDIVHARSRLPAWVAWLAMKRLPEARRPRFVTTVHGLYSVNAYSAIMTRGERVIAISNMVRDYILAHYPRCSPDVVRLIHRGVDAAQFPPGFRPSAAWLERWQAEFPELDGKRLLVLPGRLTRWKGGLTFLRLVAEVCGTRPDVHAVLVGGPDTSRSRFADELHAECQRLGITHRVTFAGTRPDIREWLAVATLTFSLPTRPEPFGRTVIEALSLGVPVVAFDRGGPAETLVECFPAGLVEASNLDALLACVVELLDKTPPEVQPCPFSLARMQHETLAVYEELLTPSAAP